MVGLALHLPLEMQYQVKQHQGKTSTFATLTNFICLFMLTLLKPEEF